MNWIYLILIYLLNFSNGAIYSENFSLGSNGWTVIGNTQKKNNVSYQTNSIDFVLNRYVIGKECLINIDYKKKDDSDLWYFTKKFSRPINASDATIITFNLYGFSGNFSDLNKIGNPVLKIVGSSGMTVQTKPNLYTFRTNFTIPFHHKIFDGPIAPVIRSIRQIYILGDWTRGHEIIGLDSISIL